MADLILVDGSEAEGTTAIPETLPRYGHFEIARRPDGSFDELGQGAMGATYRAVDTVLRATVALKVIAQNVAGLPAVRARFLREARAAARLRHPNVASVFHYGEQDGECFYAMELVEGETLEERVRRDGPLPVAAVLEVGRQVARALAAAEAQRLVHRDIKPGNLMWVVNSRPDKPGGAPLIKVIDFGLAKALTGDAEVAAGESDTRHGFVGTPAFASPEQFARAQAHPVDTRSDLYSLGVTLWYLLCGCTPFRGATLEEIHRQQTHEPLPVDQLIARRVPAPMIAVDPRQRSQSAREFTEQLERCQVAISPAHGQKRWRPRTAALALLASGALLAFLFVSARKGANSAARPPATLDRSLAVLPFENLSREPTEAFLATATQDIVTQNLARVREIKVIGADSTRAYSPGARDLPRIGRELGVRLLLEGSVRRENGHTQIAVRLVNAASGAQAWKKQYHDVKRDLYPVYREITLDVASRLQAALSQGEKAAIVRPPTTDPEAYDLLLRLYGEENSLGDIPEYREYMQRKAAWLEQAVARDPRFMLAYCGLADYYIKLARVQTGVPPEQRKDYGGMALAALRRASDLQPDAGEVHLARATYLLLIEHRAQEAAPECELARRTLPNDAKVELMAGSVARGINWEESVRCLERAAELEPQNCYIFQELLRNYTALRRYPDFDRTILRLMVSAPPSEAAEVALDGTLSALEGAADLEPLRRVRAERTADVSLRDSDRKVADLELALLSHDADAVLHALAANEGDQVFLWALPYPNAFFEGLAARIRNDTAGAQAAFERARSVFEKAVLADPDDGRVLSVLALIDAGCGRHEDAVREARRACELLSPYKKFPTRQPAARCNLATVYAWTGQPDLAFAELDAVVDGTTAGDFFLSQPTYGDFCLNPFWDPLRGDPRFAALVARLAPKTPR